MNKFLIQDNLYIFPYHYIPHFQDKIPKIQRTLSWGWEYLTYMQYIKKVIEEELSIIDSVLDVGCGDGALLNSLNMEGVEKYGIDLSEKAISFAKSFSSDAVFKVENVFSLDKKFDAVLVIEVLEHIPDDMLSSFIEKIISLINSGGYLIVSVPTNVIAVNKKHYRHYDEEILSKQISNTTTSVIKEQRLYKNSKVLNMIQKIIFNKYYSLNSKLIIKYLWEFHKMNTYYATKNDGIHLVRVYQKKEVS